MSDSLIEAQGLVKQFATGRQAVAGVDLSVRPGDLVIVLGANGEQARHFLGRLDESDRVRQVRRSRVLAVRVLLTQTRVDRQSLADEVTRSIKHFDRHRP